MPASFPQSYRHLGLGTRLRRYQIFLPPGWEGIPTGEWLEPDPEHGPGPGPRSLPVVLMFHGEGMWEERRSIDPEVVYRDGSGAMFSDWTRFHDVRDWFNASDPTWPRDIRRLCVVVYCQALSSEPVEGGFGAVSPQANLDGTVRENGSWNNGYYGPEDAYLLAEDVAYVKQVLDETFAKVQALYDGYWARRLAARPRGNLPGGSSAGSNVERAPVPMMDRDQVFLVGHGTGASFVHRLVVEWTHWSEYTFRGMAVVGGSRGGWRWFKDFDRSRGQDPTADWDPVAIRTMLPSDFRVLAIHGMNDAWVKPGAFDERDRSIESTNEKTILERLRATPDVFPVHFSRDRSLHGWAGALGKRPLVPDVLPGQPDTAVRPLHVKDLVRWRYEDDPNGLAPFGYVVALLDEDLAHNWPKQGWSYSRNFHADNASPLIWDFFVDPTKWV